MRTHAHVHACSHRNEKKNMNTQLTNQPGRVEGRDAIGHASAVRAHAQGKPRCCPAVVLLSEKPHQAEPAFVIRALECACG